MVRVNLSELVAALEYIKLNSNDVFVSITMDMPGEVSLVVSDRSSATLKVQIFDTDSKSLPKIHQVQTLKVKGLL